MKTINHETERKLYQALGIIEVISRADPDSDKEQRAIQIERLAEAAEGAAHILEEAAAAITEAIHG